MQSANDREKLKNMFSKNALSEIENFEEQADELFQRVQGTVVSWERTGFTGSASVDNGEKTAKSISWHDVTIEKSAYVFFMIDHTEDTADPDNIGLYALRVVKKEEENTALTFWQDMQIPGISVP